VTLPTLASPSPDLTFVTNLNLNPAIKAVEAGSSRVAVSLGEAANSRLSWQNGQALFSSKVSGDPEIYLASSDRPQPTNLTLMAGDDLQPAWSPDGRRLAFSSGRKGNLDIYVMECVNPPARCGGGKVTQLTTSRGFEEWPAWSPDGRRLAFVSDRDGNVEIYVMDTDGQNQQRLTQNPADDWPAAWSPDGRWIVFASQPDGNWNLYVMNSTGQQVQRLTNDPADEREPVWSPDGRTIAFGYNGNGNWDIYTVPAPGATPGELPRNAWTQVTATSTDERYPAWLPR
jgi:TolB protein